MPRMDSGGYDNSPPGSAAFRSAVPHQRIIAEVIFPGLGQARRPLRPRRPTAPRTRADPGPSALPRAAEHRLARGRTGVCGARGGGLIYCVGGARIGLPERTWQSPRLGRLLLAGLGVLVLGMAVLQAWPGRGFWQGTTHGQPGTLAGMTTAMAQTPQPHALSAWVSAFTTFDQAHGFAVNLFAVVALTVIGGIFLTGRPQLIRPAIAAFTVLCLADWSLIEDFGFFGGLGTDPNSMIPFALLAISGYLALTPTPTPAAEPATATAPSAEPATAAAVAAGWRDRFGLTALRDASFGTVAALGAVGLIILGAAPMAAAQANPNADPILAQAIAGSHRAAELPRQKLPAHRPARANRDPGQSARPGRAAQ